MKHPVVYWIEGKMFFRESWLPPKWLVQKRLGVQKSTYAGNVISRMYDYYFQGAVNFKWEYRTYYRKEFATVENYLEQRYHFSREEAEVLVEGNYSMKSYGAESPEKNMENLNYDKDFEKAFYHALTGEKMNED